MQLAEPLFAGSLTARTVWWQWTSPVNGHVDLIGPTGTAPTARLFTGDTLSYLRNVPVTAPANGVQRFSASSGTTYLIGFSGGNTTTAAIRAALELRAARPLPPNDRFADAIALTGASANSTSHNWGASVETGEPSDHARSLWWTWTAPRNGSANVNASSGVVHLYRGDSTDSLVSAANPYSNVSLYPVLAGDIFRIAVSTTANQSDITINIQMTPPGDDFHDPILLPSIQPAPANVDLSQMGWEPLEPTHNGKPAEHSVWFRWIAPDNTPVALDLTSSSQTRISVYTGEALTALSPVAEGSKNVTFIPQRDQTYYIVIDQNAGAFSGQVTLSLSQQLTGYAAWRLTNFPDPNSPDADPHADPDGDGRVNLLEMALGTDPTTPDVAPATLRIRDLSGNVTLSSVRPTGISGLRYTFEIASGLGQPWQDAQKLEHLAWTESLGDGWEEFHVLLIPLKTADHSSYFARLRIEID